MDPLLYLSIVVGVLLLIHGHRINTLDRRLKALEGEADR